MHTDAFEFELRPHRSLSPAAFRLMIGVFASVCAIAALVFAANGLWFVPPFLGLDAALLYFLFRANYRAARAREHLRIDPDHVAFTAHDARGRLTAAERFQTFWVRLVFEERDETENRLALASHGRERAVGTFLGAGERARLAPVLARAIADARAGEPTRAALPE